MSNLVPSRRSLALGRLGADRATGNALATIQTGAFLERAENEAQRSLALARMSDIGAATHHALDEGDAIIRDLIARAESNPLGANALGGIAEDGIRGVRRELHRLSEGF
jgi:chloramphenicol 3-O-phosphotransferase